MRPSAKAIRPEPAAGGTTLTNKWDLQPTSASLRLLGPLAIPKVKSAVAENLRTLKQILENVCRVNRGPLSNDDLKRVYERMIDVMRTIQKLDMQPQVKAAAEGTEFDVDVND